MDHTQNLPNGYYIKGQQLTRKMKMMMNAYDGQQFLHQIIAKLLKKNLKTYLKKLNMKIRIFYYTKETGKPLSKIICQLLLTSYLHHKIVEK